MTSTGELPKEDLTFKKIFRFWTPLSATWLMMSVEGPFLSAIIARMVNPEYNLAAYGIAFAFAMIIEAPVILLMSASTALVKNYYSYIKLRNFTFGLIITVTLIIIVFITPQVFYFITVDLMELSPRVSVLTHHAIVCLIPWPGAIGYRRFNQGILIRNNLTRRVAYGTIVRLTMMASSALFFHFFTSFEGAVVGCAALGTGVVSEAVASRIMTIGAIKDIKSGKIQEVVQADLSYGEIFKFYYPLALTSVITLGVQPMVTFFLGQSRMALESLAVLPVINSFVFIFRSFGLSYQEVGIALMGNKKEGYPKLRNFALLLGIVIVGLLGLIAFTPLSKIWFYNISGLSADLTGFAKLPLMILVLMPGLSVLLSFQTAVLVNAHNTKPITFSTIIEFSGILIVMFTLTHVFLFVGAVAATIGFIIGRLGANAYLFMPYFEALRNKQQN